MKLYPGNSALTVRQRIEKAYNIPRKHDVYVTVHNNADGDGYLFGFYLNDWKSEYDDFQSYPELDYRVDSETQSPNKLNLGINYSRKEAER